MDGDISDRTTLKRFLEKIEKGYGKARRVWVMGRGMPSEALLAEMRERQVFYLVGTPRSKVAQHAQRWLDQPWQQVRDSVRVKLFEHEGELWVLAESQGRRTKEIAIRRKRLARLLRKLRAMRHSLPSRDRLLLRIGAAKKEVGRAFGLVKIHVPETGQAVTRQTFHFHLDKAKLSALEQRDGHYLLRSNLSGEDPAVLWTRYIQLTQIEAAFRHLEERLGGSSHLPSPGTSSGGPHLHRLSGLLSAGHAEEPVDAPRSRTDAPGGAGEVGHHSDDRGMDSHPERPLAGAAPLHATGKRGADSPRPDEAHAALAAATAIDDGTGVGFASTSHRQQPHLW